MGAACWLGLAWEIPSRPCKDVHPLRSLVRDPCSFNMLARAPFAVVFTAAEADMQVLAGCPKGFAYEQSLCGRVYRRRWVARRLAMASGG